MLYLIYYIITHVCNIIQIKNAIVNNINKGIIIKGIIIMKITREILDNGMDITHVEYSKKDVA